MLCPSCGTNVGKEARLCKTCSNVGVATASRGSNLSAGDAGLSNAISSSIVGVTIICLVLVGMFGMILHKIFDRVSMQDGVLFGMTTVLLIAVIMGRAFINGARIMAPLGLLRVVFIVLLLVCSVELSQRPIVEFSLNMTKRSIEADESVQKLQRSDEWFGSMQKDIKEGAEKFKSAVKP